jgi:hypothetical protein
MPDYRLNSRSPYYIEGAIPVTEATPPTPIQNNTPPTVTITVSNETPYIGESVTITAEATDSDGSVVSYEWSTGDTTQSIVANPTFFLSPSGTQGCTDFYVVVTDNDGDTANAIKRVCWQKVPEIIQNEELNVNCGDTVNEAAFTGQKVYNIKDVGDKIGDVKIAFKDFSSDIYANSLLRATPVKFTLEWNNTTQTTGYIGDSVFDSDLTANGVAPADINTASNSNKDFNTELTINKTAPTPSEVKIIAETPLVNDRFSFTINCPNPTTLAAPTHNYTLKATSSTADFQYNDSDGVTQTITLNQNTPTIVIAQEDSVSVTSGTGNIVEGSLGFANGTPTQTLDQNTEFIFWLDDSGSLDDEINSLIDMTNNELKDSFLSYYDNDISKYQSQVIYNTDPVTLGIGSGKYAERFLEWSGLEKQNTNSTKLVHIIYIDEAHASYHRGTPSQEGDNSLLPLYSSDLAALRTSLDNQQNFGDKMIIVFCVEKTIFARFRQFTHFINNVTTGANGFDGANGLSDRSEVIFVRNVLPGQDSAYYHQKTIDALKQLGYNIT